MYLLGKFGSKFVQLSKVLLVCRGSRHFYRFNHVLIGNRVDIVFLDVSDLFPIKSKDVLRLLCCGVLNNLLSHHFVPKFCSISERLNI